MARKIEIEIVGDVSGLSKAFNKAAGDTDSFGSRVGKLGTSIAKMGALAGVAIGAAALGGLAVTIRAGITEFAEAARVGAQTNAVLESTGGIANVTAQQVSRLAESLMRKSGVDDEAIQSGENMLLTFTKVRNEVGAGNDIFNQATTAALNFSVATGKDMVAASLLVGKALNDPIKGLTALSRSGVQFSEDQKTMIKSMVAAGDTMGAQKIILKELNTQFGGSAEALGKTLPGQINILKQSFSNLAGEIVGKLAPAFAKGVTEITSFVSKLSAAKGMEAKIKVVFEGLQELGSKAIQIGVDVGKQLSGALGKVDWAAAGTAIAKAIGAALKVGIPAALDLATTFTKGLLAAVDAIDWVSVGREIGIGVKDGVKKGAVSWVKGGMLDMLKAGANPGLILQNAIGKDVGEALGKNVSVGTVGGMKVLPGTITGALNSSTAASSATASAGGNRLGANLALGMASGIAANASAAAIQAAVMVNEAYWSAATVAHIRSPSKLFAGIGANLVLGLVQGLEAEQIRFYNATSALFGKAAEAAAAGIARIKALVDARMATLGASFEQLGGLIDRAFGAKTQSLLTNLSSAWDVQISKVRAWGAELTNAERALSAFDLAGQAQTMSELALATMDAAEAERSRQQALSAAGAALSKAQAMPTGEDAKQVRELADAKQDLATAQAKNASASTEATLKTVREAGQKVADLEKGLGAETLQRAEERSAAILAAEESLRSANLAITRAGLQAQATLERDALAAKRLELAAAAQQERAARDAEAAERIAAMEAQKAAELQNLEEFRRIQGEQLTLQLAQLQAHLLKHPKEWSKTQAAIVKLLKGYGVDYNKAGELLGNAFASGLKASEAAVEAAAKNLAKIPKSYLQLKSPAEKGPLSTINSWFKPMGTMLAKQMNGSALAGAASRMASGAAMGGPSMAMAGAGARGGGGSYGGPERIILQVDGRTLAEVTRKEWQRTIARNK